MPQYEVKVAVWGQLQWGGKPSCFDRVLASRMGVFAVETLLLGKSNLMVGIDHDKLILSPLKTAVKSKSEINKDLIRISDILST